MQVLVIRLSAIGDVAMAVPVIYSVARANPEDTFTVLTQYFLLPVFQNRPANINLLGIDTQGAQKDLRGLLRFAFTLSQCNFDKVLDLHDVLRSKVIGTVFRLQGTPVYVIDKGRKERKQLTAARNKKMSPLMHMTERYAEVFRKVGFGYRNSFTSLFEDKKADNTRIQEVTGSKNCQWIGIAPFAKHRGKIYPLEAMRQVIRRLSTYFPGKIFLFGAAGREQLILEEFEEQFPNVQCIAGKLPLEQELVLISNLDLLVSMDSANMHFASLVGTRVLSIWGATHPYAGFYGFNQHPEDIIQLSLPCRPCSVFGDKACRRSDWACMEQLPPEKIVDKVIEMIG
ncbi:MAG: glycosyltransferase family 9 protein [Tannerellaceae bacterium]|nr:glycosyltransferase family 9 protein [Tannerellaceae bacterium]MCD8264978.1 glycosyltransferase family 9 protein [Tannerellaceae bacterium]